MTQYATLQDLAQYMPAGVLSSVTTPQQTAALIDASAMADSALGNQYDLPLSPPYPRDVIAAVCKQAAVNLMSGIIGYSAENGANEWVGRYAKDADTYFSLVAQGKRTPQGIIDATPTTRTGGARCASSPKRGW